jgi:environmental stress-induced protein Ves
MSRTVWRAADQRQTTWRNGGGLTREVAVRPPSSGLDDFDWRISVAEVRAGGPFSPFPGVDRTIVLIDGPVMLLTVDGARHELRRHQPFTFDGAATTVCEVPAGPTRDLNVMTRRERFRAATEVVHLSGGDPIAVTGGEPLVLLTLAGAVTAVTRDGSTTYLAEEDCLCWAEPAQAVLLSGAGTVAVVRLAPQ